MSQLAAVFPAPAPSWRYIYQHVQRGRALVPLRHPALRAEVWLMDVWRLAAGHPDEGGRCVGVHAQRRVGSAGWENRLKLGILSCVAWKPCWALCSLYNDHGWAGVNIFSKYSWWLNSMRMWPDTRSMTFLIDSEENLSVIGWIWGWWVEVSAGKVVCC